MHKNHPRRHHNYRTRPYQLKQRRICTKACTLFGFQVKYVLWMSNIRRSRKTNAVIPNCDVGLGKTVMTLVHAREFGWNSLFVCPTNVVSHIADEVLKHYGPDIKVLIAQEWPCFIINRPHVVIMSYHTIARLDHTYVNDNPWRFNTCVVDEVQDAEGKPKVKDAIMNVIQANFFIGLTAAERITLLPLCTMLHAKPSFKIIRTFRQPPHFDRKQYFLPLTEKTRPAYEQLKHSILHMKQSGLRKHQCLKDAWELLSLEKVPVVAHFLMTIPPSFKTVIVSTYTATLRMLANQLPKARYLLLDTKVPGQDKRHKILYSFEASNCNFLLASRDIIYLGHDLGFCDILVNIDSSYGMDSQIQLTGRLRRTGQSPKNVKVQQVVDFIVQNTCDEELFRQTTKI